MFCRIRFALLLGASSICACALSGEPALQVVPRLLSANSSALDASFSTEETQLATTATASLDPADPSLLRLESAWVQSLPGSTRLKLGDAISNPGELGSAVRFAGVQLGTPFALRTDVVAAPRVAISGAAVLPTRADVLFDGADGIAAGRTFNVGTSLAARPRVTAPGCAAYSMSLGRIREDYAIQANRYGPLFANGNVSCGTRLGLTAEAHGEYLKGDTGIAGVNLTQRVGGGAAASVGVAASEYEAGRGWSLRAGLSRSGELFDVDLRARLQSEGYRDIGAAAGGEPIEQRLLASVAARVTPNSKLGVAYAVQRTWAHEQTDIIAVTQTIGFGPRGSMSFIANHAMSGRDTKKASSSLNLSFARKLSY